MKFKHDSMYRDWPLIHPSLRHILVMLDAYSELKCGRPIVLTSLFRPEDTESMHSKCRAADIRTKHYTAGQIIKMENFLFVFRNDQYSSLAVEPHNELKGGDYQHLHIHIKEA